MASEERDGLVDVWSTRVRDYLDARAPEVVSSLCRLVRLPSVSGTPEENSISERLATELASLGADVDRWQVPLGQLLDEPDFPGVEVDRAEAWGVVGRLPGRGGGASLMLNCHVDVVPPGGSGWHDDPFGGRVRTDAVHGDVVHGRGACDMKGGLIAAQWAARALCALGVPLRGDLLVAYVQGEEDGGLGTYAMLKRGWRADACIIAEPTSLDISPASGGSLTFRLRVPGLATHASRRTSGVSAVEKFWPVFAALRRLEAERNTDPGPLMAPWDIAYPIEIGTIRSGTWASTVPEELVAEGRFGVAQGESVHDARAAFEAALAQAGAEDSWLRDHPVQVEWWGGQFAPGATALDSPIVATVQAAHARVAGTPQRIWGSPYGSDLRLMTGLGGVPTVHYGPGDARRAHGPDELVPIAEVLAAAQSLAVAAMLHCGLG